MASPDDEANLILHRGTHNFVVLNRFPYITGHMMIVPYRHLSQPTDATAQELGEMMDLAKTALTALKEQYNPHGFNMGMNIGRVAGAGIEDHIHMHMLPRWDGDTNFLTVVGDARIIPESLEETYRKLKIFFRDLTPPDGKSQ
jgi:ATP adenylyltransferase